MGESLKEFFHKSSTTSEGGSDVKKVQTFKTVIKEDGSYGTEVIEEITGTGSMSLANSKYKWLVSMLSKNNIFLISFFRTISELIAKIDRESPEGKRAVANTCLSIFLLYGHKQKEGSPDQFVFTELNQIVKNLLNEKQSTPRIILNKLSSTPLVSSEPENVSEKSTSQFDDMLNFRVLKSFNKQPVTWRY